MCYATSFNALGNSIEVFAANSINTHETEDESHASVVLYDSERVLIVVENYFLLNTIGISFDFVDPKTSGYILNKWNGSKLDLRLEEEVSLKPLKAWLLVEKKRHP